MSHPTNTVRKLVIRGGRVIDPASNIDRIDDLTVVDGRIESVGPQTSRELPTVDATGLIVCPGLVDMHVHLREPGGEHKETVATGTAAAAAGGFTSVACMPNTSPAIDNAETLDLVQRAGSAAGHCRVYPIVAITRGRRGAELVPMAALREAGAIAFSDDGDGVEDDRVMRAALEEARRIDALVIQHCEFKALSAGGVIHKGEVAGRLGLPGIDPRAEEAMIERDIDLARDTGARYHVAHISTAKGVDLVRRARREGLPVSAEVGVHHLILTDQACAGGDPNTKMHPPLRSEADVEACIAGLADGTIDCIVTDHAPHSAKEKAAGMLRAPFGIVGLETALPLMITRLVGPGRLDWAELVRAMSTNPAAILKLTAGTLAAGAPADITLIDPDVAWRIDASGFRSASRNTPFDGWDVVGRAAATVMGGQVVYRHEAYAHRFGSF